jgi:hypothetical protein
VRFKVKPQTLEKARNEVNRVLEPTNLKVNELGNVVTLSDEYNFTATSIENAETLGIFISHSTKDLKNVNLLTEELEGYGFNAFVSHRNIDPSKE